MKKTALFLSLILILALVLVGCGSDVKSDSAGVNDKSAPQTEQPKEEPKKEEPKETVFGLGERVVISEDGKELYAITFNSVKNTDERNQFSDKKPVQVIVIDYTYENISGDEELFIQEFNFKIIDEGGTIADTYPAGAEKIPQTLPAGVPGTNCTAQVAYGLMNESNKVKLLYYDNMFNSKPDATFEIEINE